MNPSTETSDPYRPLAGALKLVDPVQGLINGPSRRAVVRILREFGARKVLDVGCGSGGLCCCLAKAGLRTTGLDSSETMLARARQKAGTPPRFKVVRGEAANFPFGDGEFDAAVVSLALHEMDPALRDTAYAEMHRVVRSGGLIVLVDFTLPEADRLLARMGRRFIESDERGIGNIHPPHYANYMEFMDGGGLQGWVHARGGGVTAESSHLWGNIGVLAIERR